MNEKSMTALAEILRESGIEVTQVLESLPAPRRLIVYSGDKDTGFQAVDIASEHGYPVVRLECLWMIGSKRFPVPEWTMIISRSE